MDTRFSTGDIVFIPAKIASTKVEDGTAYYRIIKEMKPDEWIPEDVLISVKEQLIRIQTAKASVNIDCTELDEAKEKIKQLEEEIKTANSLLDELAAKEVTVRVSSVRT